MKTLAILFALLSAGTAAAATINCDQHAAELLAKAGNSKQPVLVPVKTALCVEAAKYPNAQIGDSQSWRVEVAERDANKNAVTITVRPQTKTRQTSLYLVDTEGYIHPLFLTPVDTSNGQDVTRDEHGNMLVRLSEVEWTPAKKAPNGK